MHFKGEDPANYLHHFDTAWHFKIQYSNSTEYFVPPFEFGNEDKNLRLCAAVPAPKGRPKKRRFTEGNRSSNERAYRCSHFSAYDHNVSSCPQAEGYILKPNSGDQRVSMDLSFISTNVDVTSSPSTQEEQPSLCQVLVPCTKDINEVVKDPPIKPGESEQINNSDYSNQDVSIGVVRSVSDQGEQIVSSEKSDFDQVVRETEAENEQVFHNENDIEDENGEVIDATQHFNEFENEVVPIQTPNAPNNEIHVTENVRLGDHIVNRFEDNYAVNDENEPPGDLVPESLLPPIRTPLL